MRLTWFPLVNDRRPMLVGLVLALALVLGAASLTYAQAAATPQQPAAAGQQAAPAPEKKAIAFQNDVGIVLVYVKADKTADFEDLVTKLKDGFAKTDVAELKQEAASLRFLKAPNGPAPAGNVLYVMLADPAVKNVEYWFLSNLYKFYPNDTQAMFQKWTDAKGTVSPVPFDLSVLGKMQ
jgi:hypothetical protein